MSGNPTAATDVVRRCAKVGRLWPLAGLFLLGAPPPAWAQQPDQLYTGCELDSGTIEAIQNDINESSEGSISSPQVSFIVVYAIDNTNNGQIAGPYYDEFTTGPVVCTSPSIAATPTTEDTPPNGGDPVTVDSADEALVLRTTGEGEGEGSPPPEDRFCHTVEDHVDCVRIFVTD